MFSHCCTGPALDTSPDARETIEILENPRGISEYEASMASLSPGRMTMTLSPTGRQTVETLRISLPETQQQPGFFPSRPPDSPSQEPPRVSRVVFGEVDDVYEYDVTTMTRQDTWLHSSLDGNITEKERLEQMEVLDYLSRNNFNLGLNEHREVKSCCKVRRETPLHVAVKEKDYDMVKLLVIAGADLGRRNDKNESALACLHRVNPELAGEFRAKNAKLCAVYG